MTARREYFYIWVSILILLVIFLTALVWLSWLTALIITIGAAFVAGAGVIIRIILLAHKFSKEGPGDLFA